MDSPLVLGLAAARPDGRDTSIHPNPAAAPPLRSARTARRPVTGAPAGSAMTGGPRMTPGPRSANHQAHAGHRAFAMREAPRRRPTVLASRHL
jgi:hypothetical protein